MAPTPAQLIPFLPVRLARWAPQFCAAELVHRVPAELVAAVCDRESGGGEYTKPKGPAGTGDRGRGHGLMQIDARYHRSFILARFSDGRYLWADPTQNVLYGSWLLSSNYERTRSWPMALALYNASEPRVRGAAAGATDEPSLIAAVDSVTTGGDYVSDCLRRMANFGGRV